MFKDCIEQFVIVLNILTITTIVALLKIQIYAKIIIFKMYLGTKDELVVLGKVDSKYLCSLTLQIFWKSKYSDCWWGND